MNESNYKTENITADDGTEYVPCEIIEAQGLWSNGKFIEGEFSGDGFEPKTVKVFCGILYGDEWKPLGAIPVKKVVPKKEPLTVESVYREALEKLAKLGNGDRYGNSDGNKIAQDAIAWADSRLKPAPATARRLGRGVKS